MITLSSAMTLPIHLIKKKFVHNYCRTCHSFPRSSIDEAIAIFDHKFAYATRKWLYTAITRATDLKQVYFYDYDKSKKTEREMLQYFTRKVKKYRQQDKKAKRSIDDANYKTKEWLVSCVGKACGSCGDCLTYSRSRGKIDSNLTAQRVSNNEAHHLDNIIPYCVASTAIWHCQTGNNEYIKNETNIGLFLIYQNTIYTSTPFRVHKSMLSRCSIMKSSVIKSKVSSSSSTKS